ncbi:glucuronyl esterase domain-containing protein [Streptomyces laurentii]|uniref:glucuronyl esterase domain-containing protein n=1 Tax=Streptomyces laurentii TaxID=39478 RepID=UPI00368F00B2
MRRPGLWAASTAAVVALGLAVATLDAYGTTTRPTVPAAAAAGVEDDGADCPVANTAPPATSLLPDPFTKLDGTRVTTKSGWRCRRAEIKELAERTVYGQKPAKPANVTGTVSSSGITVNVSDQGRSASFSASVSLPSGTGPFPLVLVVGGLGADTATIKASGAAVVSYNPLDVGKEGTARNAKSGAFYSLYGSTSSTGLLAAWAWGASRIIDVIEQSGGAVLRADAVGVTGCSRYGKGALAVGAFDQRVALTMPIESGTAGVPAYRSVAQESGAQPLSSGYSEQPWLGDAFGSYQSNPGGLPVDTHEVLGMIAPRGLFVMENPHVDWLGATSGSVAALGGAEIYKALGAGGNISYWSDVADGTHCAVRSEWKAPLQASINAFLKKSGTPPAVFRVSAKKAGNLSQWRSWTTPTLADDGGGTANGGTTNGGTVNGGTANGGTTNGGTTNGGTTNGGTTNGGTTDGGTSSGSSGGTGGGCTATHRTVSSWNGGYQGEVTVTNAGSGTIDHWAVAMTLPSGEEIASLWSGTASGTGGNVTVRNAAYNGTLGAGASTTFGFTVNGPSTPPSGVSCGTS